MTKNEILERIMTDHWDIKACECWICIECRALGLRPQSRYLWTNQKPEDQRPRVPMPRLRTGSVALG